jgi:hypothetical protein
MIKICDIEAKVWILSKLEGKTALVDGDTLEDDVDYFMGQTHHCYLVEGGRGFICYSLHAKYINVAYVWSDMSMRAHKELIQFGKMLYKRYTIDNEIPIYYSGLINFYPNHSKEVAKDLWQFMPKDY